MRVAATYALARAALPEAREAQRAALADHSARVFQEVCRALEDVTGERRGPDPAAWLR